MAVRFTILGPATIKGDVQNNIVQATLEEARDRMVEAFEAGTFTVYFMFDPLVVSCKPVTCIYPLFLTKRLVYKRCSWCLIQGSTQFTPVPGTLRVIEGKEDPKAFRPTNAPLSKFSCTQYIQLHVVQTNS